MIAIDTSALILLALREPGRAQIEQALQSDLIAIGWPTVLELKMVLARRRPKAVDDVIDRLLKLDNATFIHFGADHFGWASLAFDRFGKGGGHPAQLNYGDCMTYAVAMALNAPLLFRGGDFAKTDLRVHPASIAG